MKTLRVDVWSDIACPWCYVGKRRLEAALARFAASDAVQVVWRAFELDPAAPRVRDQGQSYAERLAQKYATPLVQAESMIRNMTELAAREGLSFRFDQIRPGNTFDAHRVLHLALDRGVQDAVKERLLLAYMTEGQAIGLPDVLVRLAAEGGLDADEVRAMLASDDYTREVRADEEKARALCIGGVPFFAIAGRYGVSGAQPAEALLRVLERTWNEAQEKLEVMGGGGTCGPDACV